MNRQRPDIIAFAEDWGRHPTSSQHLLRCLAVDHQILYVNSLGLRRPRFNTADVARAARKLKDAITPSHAKHVMSGVQTTISNSIEQSQASANLQVYSPLAISWPSSHLAFQVNRVLLKHQISKQSKARGFERPVLWTSLPSALPVVGTLGERGLVYYCGDDFGALVGVDHEPVMAMEKRLVDQADYVFAASEALADRFPSHKTVLVPHGTDIDHFSKPASRPKDLPDAPLIAGFYGSLDDRLNLDMLAETAKRLPDWQFVLIGPVKTDLSPIAGLHNIHVLGPRSYRDLPGYVQHWQVSILLYRDEAQVRAGNPLKLREYLAAGSPIATIDLPALKPYANLISISATPAKFADAIIEAARDTFRNPQRQQSIANESWHHRAQTISDKLEELL